MKPFIVDYVTYNVWANNKIVNLFKDNKKDLSHIKIESSFPSVRETMQHIWFAEMIWLTRLDNSPVTKAYFMSKTNDIPINLFYTGFLETSKVFQVFVTKLNEEEFSEVCHYQNTSGVNFQQSFSEIIVHCMNHSTYHRGQLIMMARQLGINDIESTDYISYLREKQKVRRGA